MPFCCANVRSVGSSGTPGGRFQRAIDHGNLLAAESAARELEWLPLAHAFELLLLIQRKDPPRFDRAAARFVGKFVTETRGVRICDVQLLLGALAGLDGLSRRVSLEAVEALATSFQHGTLARAAKRANREK